jgi:hypothetical protein
VLVLILHSRRQTFIAWGDSSMLKRSFIAVLAVLVTSAAADAAVITFTDRATWAAAAGGVSGGENFNGFVADTGFQAAPVALASGMSVGLLVDDGNTLDNLIDAPAGGLDSETNVNGTSHANVFNGQAATPTTPFISFSTSVFAFGADFMNLNDGANRTVIELYNGAVLVDTLAPAVVGEDVVRFFGFVSDTAISQIRFVRLENDVFGIDDIEVNTEAAVPEPASLLLMGAAFGAVALRRRRKA